MLRAGFHGLFTTRWREVFMDCLQAGGQVFMVCLQAGGQIFMVCLQPNGQKFSWFVLFTT